MKQLLFSLLLITAACSRVSDEISLTAHDGKDGKDGIDGQSCMIESTELGAMITCADGSSAVIQNGQNGQDGSDGIDGQPGEDAESIISADYTSPGCQRIADTNSYVKISNNNKGLYSVEGCPSNSKFAEVSQGEAYWVGPKALATFLSNGVRVLYF